MDRGMRTVLAGIKYLRDFLSAAIEQDVSGVGLSRHVSTVKRCDALKFESGQGIHRFCSFIYRYLRLDSVQLAALMLIYPAAIGLASAEAIRKNIGHTDVGEYGSHYSRSKVLSSGYWSVSTSKFSSIYWIDNDRVIFVGGPMDGANFANPAMRAVRIWNTKDNSVIKYADGLGMCYSNGYIFYSTKATRDELVYREGAFGAEKEYRRVAKLPSSSSTTKKMASVDAINPLSCRGYDPRMVAGNSWEKYHLVEIVPLLDNHGFLDIVDYSARESEARADMELVRWFRAPTTEPIDLPIPKRAIYRDAITYSAWNSAYVLVGVKAPPTFNNAFGRWPKDVPQPVWFLHAVEGNVERIDLPYAKWTRGMVPVISTRTGLLVARNDGTSDQGLYLATGSGYVKVISGGARGIVAAGVSPDGCKVAAAVSTAFDNHEGGLKMTSVCEIKRK